MLKLIFDNKKKINKMGKKLRKNSQTELFCIIVGMYVLTKIAVTHEKEIANLKIVIEELKSKGA